MAKEIILTINNRKQVVIALFGCLLFCLLALYLAQIATLSEISFKIKNYSDASRGLLKELGGAPSNIALLSEVEEKMAALNFVKTEQIIYLTLSEPYLTYQK